MLLHNTADWLRRIQLISAAPSVERLSPGEVAQHWMLMLSFVVLVITGFSLRFSEAGWVQWLFGWQGGFEARGIIHRVAAVVMTLGAVWHLGYLFTARGRRWLRDMTAAGKDVTDFSQNIAFFLGLRKGGAGFGRFSYMEKLEYWALVWGTVIMTVTGILLWFDNYFIERWGLPKVVLEVMLVIHYYEAWLAFLAILVWHIYGTMFKPGVYPMNPAWLSGKMPKAMYHEEHPQGPQLPTRTVRIRYEEPADIGEVTQPVTAASSQTGSVVPSKVPAGDGRGARQEPAQTH